MSSPVNQQIHVIDDGKHLIIALFLMAVLWETLLYLHLALSGFKFTRPRCQRAVSAMETAEAKRTCMWPCARGPVTLFLSHTFYFLYQVEHFKWLTWFAGKVVSHLSLSFFFSSPSVFLSPSDNGAERPGAWKQHLYQLRRRCELSEIPYELLYPEPAVSSDARRLGSGLQPRPEGKSLEFCFFFNPLDGYADARAHTAWDRWWLIKWTIKYVWLWKVAWQQAPVCCVAPVLSLRKVMEQLLLLNASAFD